jgi:hypothetical protein
MMKWLTLFLCLLATPALAQDNIPEIPQATPPEQQVQAYPLVMQCSPVSADLMLEQQYGEIEFLRGQGSVFAPNMQIFSTRMRMFVNPDTKTYTVMIELGEKSCMLLSGNLKEMFAEEQKL